MNDSEHPHTRGVVPGGDRAKEIAAVRHDLKNMLTALRSGCVLLDAKLGDSGDAEVREYVAEMQAAVQTGSELVERLQRVESIS